MNPPAEAATTAAPRRPPPTTLDLHTGGEALSSSRSLLSPSTDSGEDGARPPAGGDGRGRSRERSGVPLYEVQLERVLGLTVASNAALDCDPATGTVAYPAGCTVVLLNARKNRQTHVQNSSRKTVTSVAYSACGRYLALGECGHQPAVRLVDLSDGRHVAEFLGHKYGVSCVAISPTQKYVVSVGSQHDMIVNVWDWRNGVKVASNKFSSKVKAVSFAENGSYFVTVGNRHVKFWYLDVARGAKFKEPVPLTGRSAILGEQRNNYFCDVACGRGEMGDSTFAITKSGLLCEFNNRRLLDKWVELRTSSANCLVAGEEYIFVGCGDAIVRCFSPLSLQFITTLPRTHYLGVDVSKGLTIKHMGQHPPNARYPDTVAVAYDPHNHKLTAVYNDHSLYVWDVTDIKRVGKSHSYLYHSACIWGVESYPSAGGGGGGLRPHQRGGSAGLLPEGSFVTCSSDDTIRVWNIAPDLPPHPLYQRNIYSNELLRVLYVDPDLSYLKDTDISPSGGQDKQQQQQQGGTGGTTDASYDSRNGVRCIKISPDGRHIASGDRAGNIRIHELQELEEVCKIEAHDAEVLCLEYTRPHTQHSLLASASRDRLIHVFDVGQDYRFLQTLDDHSSAITSVRFYQGQQGLQMVSCSADRSIIFRSASVTGSGEVAFNRGHNIAGKTTLYDMEVDYGQRHILTACQDRNIRVYSVNSGKQSKSFKGSIGDDGSLIKVVLDPSGIYAATSCTDKNMCIYDYYTAECLATMYGHSELVTGLKFSQDGRHLVSVSGDGCIFIWRLPHDMSQTITARLSQQAERATKETRRASQSTSNLLSPTRPNKLLHGPLAALHRPPSTPALHQPGYGDTDPYRPSSAGPFDMDPDTGEPDYRFSIGQLPTWAKKKVSESSEPASSPTSGNPDLPKGRWAQKVPNSSITFKSHYDTDSVVQFPSSDKAAGESESSKESSLEETGKPLPPPRPRRSSTSGTAAPLQQEAVSPSRVNTRRGAEGAHKTPGAPGSTSKRSQFGGDPHRPRNHTTDDSDGSSLRVDGGGTTTDHDGDVEDCSEQDDVSTEPEAPIYYPHNDDTTSEFRVNAMDAEELRRSQRRMRGGGGGGGGLVAAAIHGGKGGGDVTVAVGLSPAAMSGSQESDEEEEVSTPSADTSERTLLSALSCESVDKLGRRESFLKSTYESLGSDTRQHDRDNKNSISYRFNARHKEAPAVSNKKEELLKKIEETRKKLQSIGYKSSLRTSKSISDLSNIPEKDNAFMSLGVSTSSGQHASGAPGGDGCSGDSGFSSSTGGSRAADGGGLRRACSLSDLANACATPRRVLPNPTTAGGRKTRTPNKASGRAQQPSGAPVVRSNSVSRMDQDEGSGRTGPRQPAPAASKMTPRALKRKSSLSQAVSTGDIRSYRGGDSSSEDNSSPPDQKSLRNRAYYNDRRSGAGPVRAVSERDLTSDVIRSATLRASASQLRSGPTPRRQVSASDLSRPSSAASTVDLSPDDYSVVAPTFPLDLESIPLTASVVESMCEWAVESCERLRQLWWRVCAESSASSGQPAAPGEEQQQRALKALMLGAAARAQHALVPLTAAHSHTPPPPPPPAAGTSAGAASSSSDKDPRVVAMMQQYTDMLVNMVQQKMAQAQPTPPGPT